MSKVPSPTSNKAQVASPPGSEASDKQRAVSPDAVAPAPTNATLPGSTGDNSLSMTPKDVSPGDASVRDQVARHMDSSDPDEKQQEALDDAIELSFPASDPTSVAGGITRIEKPRQSTQH